MSPGQKYKGAMQRDPRLDALRGLMLILMVLVHFSKRLDSVVFEGLGYVAEAEGFVFLSGYVAGLTYARTLLISGQAELFRRVWRRARAIYLVHILTFTVALLLVTQGGKSIRTLRTWPPLLQNGGGMIALLGGTMMYQPVYLDILPMFVIFILCVPWIVIPLRGGRSWVVVWFSLCVWILSQIGLRDWITTQCRLVLSVDFGTFDILAWQLFFVSGLVLGARRVLNDRPTIKVPSWGWLVLIFASVSLFLLRHKWLPFSVTRQTEWLTNRTKLGPLRVCNFAMVALLLSQPKLWPSRAVWTTMLGYLGRHSLTLFGYHLVLLYAIRCVVSYHNSVAAPVEVSAAVLGVASLYLPAWVCEWQTRRRRKSPVTVCVVQQSKT